jgi:desulfoferrodoxin (superoxide reductase-like protein)
MSRLLTIATLLLHLPLVVGAFHGFHLQNRVVQPTSHLTIAMSQPLDESSSFFEVSRREAVNTAIRGSFLAAALASGVPPALAADIAKQMKELEKEFGDSANTNGAPEKHLPKVSLSSVKGKADLTMIEVVVPHVMDAEKPHWIQAIWLKEEGSGDVAVAKVFPATEPSPPSLTCGVPKGAKLTPYLYCNLHGLWKGEMFTA